MPKRIYVGNLPFSADEAALKKVFGRFGRVSALKVDRGRSQRFGFVEFADPTAGDKALKELAGFRLGGSRLKVSDRPL